MGRTGDGARGCGRELRLRGRRALVLAVVLAAALLAVPAVQAATFTVSTNADSGAGSFRDAINQANSSAGADVIDFALPAGQLTISPTSELPAVSGSVVIDATTQPGWVGPPIVQLVGTSAGAAATGLTLGATNSTIRGLVIRNFGGDGITATAVGPLNSLIANNYIGTDVTGSADQGNGGNGIELFAPSVTVGGSTAADRNVISGNGQNGVVMGFNASGNVVKGNYIGLNAAGTGGIANLNGVLISFAPGVNTVGGSAAGEGNVLSGNTQFGVRIEASNGQIVRGNSVGTTADGTASVANSSGIVVFMTAGTPTNLNEIGGPLTADGNLVSGNNGDGIAFSPNTGGATGNVIRTNRIGVSSTGAPLGNGGAGISIQGATTTTVGTVGAGNFITNNTQQGVVVSGASTGTSIRGNSIVGNGGLGIDLLPLGVTANDSGDVDTGPNGLQNFPVVATANRVGSTLDLSGTIDTVTTQNVTLDFYGGTTCDGTHGEGAIRIASIDVIADSPNKAWESSIPAGPVVPGNIVTATATDANGNTSEFSACVTVTGTADTLVVNSAADPGDGTCDATECTLREAIDAANATTESDTISFAIGTGAQIILPATPLPDISAPVTIDGTTQPGFGSSPLIQVDGVNIPSPDTTPGLRFAEGSNGSALQALSITQFESVGVEIDTDDVKLSGNWIGIQPDGSAGGSNGTGVRLTLNADSTVIGGASTDQNVITDWGSSNVHVAGAGTTTIASNIIGLLPDGTTGTGTGSFIGVRVDTDATSTLIGGAPTGGNVIADATNAIDLGGSSGTTVLGNLIGVEADGVTPVPIDIGVNVQGSDGNTIGSTAPGGGNTIATADDSGVLLINGSNTNTVAGNFIGTNAAGSLGLGNSSGIRELNGSNNNTIGPGNEIAYNSIEGVQVIDTGIRITANSIHDNGGALGASGLGIDLGGDGVTANDGEDTDVGPNNLQNFPELTSATVSAGDLSVSGTISTASSVRIEVFASPTCDPSGNGEGELFLGFFDLTVDQPVESFTIPGLDAEGLSDGDAITATATDAGGNSSEFSACALVAGAGQTFVVNSNADPGDGTCDASECTLREAIAASNAGAGDDDIKFAIGSGPATILLTSKLSVNDTVVIDGTTQPGFAGSPLIELDGTSVVADATPGDDGGIEIGAGASGSEVRGLVVNDFPTNGIGVYGLGITIAGNWIGLDVDGSSPRSNDFAGVYLQEATGTMVGGATAADRNVIADNDGDGVRIVGFDGFDNTVRGNWIGLAADGVTMLGNLGAGVFVNSAQNQIGPDNRIVANGSSATGVAIVAGSRNTITQNSIHDNLGLGIDLADDGVTPNDAPVDDDTGPNDLQNFPVVSAVAPGATQTDVSGSLQSIPNQAFAIEVFSSPTCDPSTNGEGTTYLGTTVANTGGSGNAGWSLTVPSVLTNGHVVTATATDSLGNTSEFSQCVTVATGGTVSTLLFIQSESGSVTAPARVELDDVPADTFIDATRQVNASPIGAIPIGAIPIGAIPIGAIPIGAIGFTDPAIRPLLSGITLSTVPLTPPRSWEELLRNTPLAGLPLQGITLQQALDALAAQTTGGIATVPIGAIGLQNNVLGTLTPEAIGLGAQSTLGAFDIADEGVDEPGDTNLQDWCEWLSGPPINCTSTAQITSESVLSTALRGAPIGAIPIGAIPIGAIPIGAIPIGAIPIGAIDLDFSPIGAIPIGAIPIGAIPIGAIPIGAIPIGAINLQASPIGAIPIGAIPIGAISTLFDCAAASCPTTGTIRDHANQLRSGLTLEQFIRAVGPTALGDIDFADVLEFVSDAGLGNLTVKDLVDTLNLIPDNGLTLADLLAAFLAEGSLGWERLNLQAANVNEVASEGGKAGYRIGIELTPDPPGGIGSVHSTSIVVTLPEGFSYVPGTSVLDQAATPEVQVPDPTVAGRVLTWTLPLAAGPGYLLDFEAVPGLTLGPTESTVEATPAGSPTATGPDAAAVTVTDTFEPNDNPVGPLTALSTTAFHLSYITGSDDVDNFTFPVPPVPGTRVTFRLSHLPADYDLVVYGPNGQVLRPQQAGTELLDGAPLDDDGPTLTSRQEALPEQTLNDVVLANLPVLGYSTLRGDDDDAVTVVSDGVAGNYTIQVTGFNGASSLEPYMLRAEQRAPIDLPACTARSFSNSGTNATALTRGTVPANVNTVFVVNKAQWERLHSSTVVGSALTSLDAQMADLAADGFPSAILQVDADAGVQTAVASWNACPTELTRANAVVREVSRVIDQFRAAHLDAGGNSTVRNIVLLGDDDAIPAARLEDRTTVANEEGYAETFGSATDLGTALRLGYFLSDDPYGDVDPNPFFDRQLHIPDVPVGRMSIPPGDVVRAVSRFTFFNGQLAPATAVTSGYDFLADGAQQVDTALRSIGGVTGQNPAGLLGNSWDSAALIAGLYPGGVPRDLVSVNGHADHRAVQPATGSTLFGIGNLPPLAPPTGPTQPQPLDRTVVFSMGCHAGLSVADTFVTAPRLGATDWAEAYGRRGATYAGNTGYGYGDGALVAYSEDLQRRFAEHLGGFATQGDLTVGEAMVLAKQDYFGELGLVGVYDEKASSELTLYGLPMWKIGPAAQPLQAGGAAAKAASSDPVGGPIASLSTPDDRQLVTEPGTGLPAEQLTTNWAPPAPTAAPGGFYVNGKDGVQVTHFRPVEPKTVLPVTISRAHGALITELSSESDTPFDPYFARPIVDAAAKEPLLDWDRLVHPAKLQTVTTSKLGPTKLHRLVLATGQFTGTEGGGETGTQRLFTHVQALVMSSPSNDYAQPILGRISATVVGSTVAFSVDTRDRAPNGPNDVVRVLVGYLDQSDGSATRAWRFVDLAHAGATEHWSGAGPLASPNAQFLFFVQALDRAGNVAVSTNKGVYYEESTQPPPVANGLEIQAPAPPPSGWFAGNVAVTLLLDGQPAAQDDDLLVDVDGNGFDAYTGAVTVSGDGAHTVTGRAPDGREVARTVLIDTAGPQALIGTPADGSQLVQGQVARADYSCLDAGAGVDPSACVGTVADGTPVDTSTPGTKSFTVNATDRLGKTGSKTVSYTVVGPPVATITGSPPPVTSQTAATFTLTATPADATLECKLDTGAFAACTSPKSYTGLAATSHTFSVRAVKGGVAGPAASFTWTITTSLTGKIVFVRGTATDHDLWLLDPSGASAPIRLTTGTQDDIQPALSPNGTTVLFARRTTAGGPYHLYRLDLAGLTTAAVSTVGTNSAPAWSRDGTKVAWDSTRTGSKGVDVFSAPWVAASGTLGAATNLSNTAGNDVTPSWSANGAQLAFASDRNKSQFEIFTMNANGSSQTRITNDPKSDIEPSWSPDGTKIAFSSDRAGGTGGFELYVMGAPNGSAQTRLTTSAGVDGQPTWLSATRIVFASARTPGGGLLSIAPTGGAATTFPGTLVGDGQPG